MDLAEAFSLKGKVALITGGSRGLGLGMASALAQAGADIMLAARGEDELNRSAAQLSETTGQRVGTMPIDLFDLTNQRELVATTVNKLGGLDILVNNAGIQVRKPFMEMTPDEYDLVTGVNLRAVFFLCQAAGRHMIESGGGKIINISSLTSKIGIQNTSAYSAAKGGVFSLTKSLAVELAPHNIRVNALAPGYFRTSLTEAAFADPARKEWIESRTPLGRSGDPLDLGWAAVYLASPASDYLTGEVLFVDGGWMSA